MSVLSALKLVAAKQQRVTDPTQLRRAKLIGKLDEQIQLALAQAAGASYTPTRTKRVKDAEGNVSTVEASRRVRPWWWAVDGGKVCVAIRYGNRVMELAKGKTAVEVTPSALAETLAVLREAVAGGELDAQIEAVSATVAKRFQCGGSR